MFPNAVTEAADVSGAVARAIDADALAQEINARVVSGNEERYQFTWPGKKNAMLLANSPTASALRPCRDESADFDNTGNLYIEGDNLDVLKLLRETHLGRVKMVYIDPPYNTGNDLIFNDNFAESVGSYLARGRPGRCGGRQYGDGDGDGDGDSAGDSAGDGQGGRQQSAGDGQGGRRMERNIDRDGTFHTNWLYMMYPRLRVAKDLLYDDGVIFISIDDNELKKIKKICNEIFGESNFKGHIHWRRRHNQPNDKTKMIGLVAEHIITYAKNSVALREKGVGKIDLTGSFSNPDNDPRGDWASKPWKVGSGQSGSRYVIISPKGASLDEVWMGEEATYQELLADNRIFYPRGGGGMPRKKYFKFEREEEGQCATNWWEHAMFGHNQGANDCMADLFGVKNIFSNPKPVELLRGLLKIANVRNDDIVLDFFSGSATTAHAVMQLNMEDIANAASPGRRRFIMVQLPEACDEGSEAAKAGYKNICEIGKERIRRAGQKIVGENPQERTNPSAKQLVNPGANSGAMPDIGFRVLKLESGNMTT
jgi:adenine-specific DNA-methyltransferase